MDNSRSAFEGEFRSGYPALVRVLRPIVGSVEDAEGVAQDAYLKAFVRWKRISRYDQPGAWIRRVAIRDAVRAAERNRRTVPAFPTAAEPTDATIARVDVERALDVLPPRQRACVVLHHLADWPVRDVAEALGCGESTVRVHLHRARLALAIPLEGDPKEMIDGR